MIMAIDRETVRQMALNGAPLIEVLPAKEFAEQHLPGAINIPLKKLTGEAIDSFSKELPVIVYCWDHQ